MVDPAPAQAGEALLLTDAEPPADETAADAADPPQPRAGLWRRLRRSRLAVAALLPALLLAAVFVAAPFAGTGSHPVDQPGPSPAASYLPGTGSVR